MAVRTLSVCTGVGGLDLGIELALGDVRPLAYVEREVSAAEILAARFEDGSLPAAPIWSDLATFPASDVAGMVDILLGGLPCTPFSVAGKRKGEQDERFIWPDFLRIVEACRPALVFLENVPPFVAGGHFREIGEALSALGYRIEDPLFLAASDVGAPHRRERVFILAVGKPCELLDGRTWFDIGRDMEEATGRTDSRREVPICDSATRAERDVALPALGGRRELREPPERDGQPDGGDEGMGDAERPERRPDKQHQQLPEGREQAAGGPRGAGEPVDHPTGPRSGSGKGRQGPAPRDGARLREPGGRRDAVEDPGRARFRGTPEPQGFGGSGPPVHDSGAGRVLADAQRTGCETAADGGQRPAETRQREADWPTGGDSTSLFPPGPADHEAWRELLVRQPWMRPAISQAEAKSLLCGGADGIPKGLDFEDRTDRLRALGNAVCPTQGAAALRELLRRHGGEEK